MNLFLNSIYVCEFVLYMDVIHVNGLTAQLNYFESYGRCCPGSTLNPNTNYDPTVIKEYMPNGECHAENDW